MTALLKIGGALLSYWWIVAVVIGLCLVAAFAFFGRSVFVFLKAVMDFFRSPVGQLIAFGVVIYIAMCVGFNWAEGLCDAQKLREDLRRERISHALLLKQIKDGNQREVEDAARRGFDDGVNKANQDRIDATPKNSNACLDADAADRVRNVK